MRLLRHRFWLWLILAVLPLLFSVLLLRHDLTADRSAQRLGLERQFDLMGRVVADELEQGRYQDLTALFERWGRDNEDIAGLSLTAANGFVLASHGDAASGDALERHVNYGRRGDVTFRLVPSAAAAERRLRGQLVSHLGAIAYYLFAAALMLRMLQWRGRQLALASLDARLRRLAFQLLAGRRQQRDPTALAEDFCRLMMTAGTLRLCWIGRFDQPAAPVTVAAWSGAAGLDGEQVVLSALPLAREASQLRRPVIRDALPFTGAAGIESLRLIALPLLAGDRLVGGAVFGSERQDAFAAGERDLLEELVRDVAADWDWSSRAEGSIT